MLALLKVWTVVLAHSGVSMEWTIYKTHFFYTMKCVTFRYIGRVGSVWNFGLWILASISSAATFYSSILQVVYTSAILMKM